MSHTVERPYKQSRASRGIFPAARALAAVLALLLGALGLFAAAPAQAQTAQTVPSNWSLKPSGVTAGDGQLPSNAVHHGRRLRVRAGPPTG